MTTRPTCDVLKDCDIGHGYSVPVTCVFPPEHNGDHGGHLDEDTFVSWPAKEELIDMADQDEVFDEWWRRLSAQGACDAFGGVQYERVKADWTEDGRPDYIEEYIRAKDRGSWLPAIAPPPRKPEA